MTPPFGSLAGLRVLDLTQALAGPFCTQILADHGADVVKIEPPVSGDMARMAGLFHPDDTARTESGYFHSINRNKRSVVIDLKAEAGRDLLLRMLPEFDVLVENFRTGVMDRLGLSWEKIHSINPRLVYGCVRGFGDPRMGDNPYIDWPAFDVVAQAMGGMIGITGEGPETPTKIGPGVGDTVPALYLTIGILSAVLNARQTGMGQFVDVAMLDAVLAVSERIVHQRSFGQVIAQPEGNHHPFIVPFGIFRARDGHIALACHKDSFFKQFCTALGAVDLVANPILATTESRRTNRKEAIALIGQVTEQFTKAELQERLGGLVPFGPVLRIDEIAQDPYFTAREMIVPIEVPPISSPMQVAGVPIKFSETPGGVHCRGPKQGEHTNEVLVALGIEIAEIESLRDVGAIK